MILKPGIRRFVGQTGANRHLATVPFWAPLKSSLALVRGVGSATFTRATSATCYGYQETDNAGASQSLLTIPAGYPRFPGARWVASTNSWSLTFADGTPIPDATFLRYLSENTATNYFLNSGAPATQTISLGTGTYTMWLTGTGSVAIAAGTATITGAGTATAAAPLTFTVTAAGTVTATVTPTVTTPQLENTAFQTSYIATAGAAVVRNTDLLSYPGSGNINDAAGTILLEVGALNNPGAAVCLALGVGTDRHVIGTWSGVTMKYTHAVGGVTTNLDSGVTLIANSKNKIAVSWGPAGMAICVNGGAVATNAVTTYPVVSTQNIYPGSDSVTASNQNDFDVRIWKSQLANSTLQALTT